MSLNQVEQTKNTKGSFMGSETKENLMGLNGMEYIEFSTPDPNELERLFYRLGFRLIAIHNKKDVRLFRQGRINFILNRETDAFSKKFYESHGPSICATGFRVDDAKKAYEMAIEKGARPCEDTQSHSFHTIYGIGDSAINFIDNYEGDKNYAWDFRFLEESPDVSGFSMSVIDHMTNNVPVKEMDKWCDFYSDIFNFNDIRYFDIKGLQTGLVSKVMRSPCKKIIIPINEPTDSKSQIQEYLDEYHGSGIQHVALLTDNIIDTVTNLKKNGIEFLSVPDTYYDEILNRLPNVEEDIEVLRDLSILVDGDEKGYLLQIFTKNLIGPIFFEIIQRKNHDGFGEGNFQALFDSIEKDQRERGVL